MKKFALLASVCDAVSFGCRIFREAHHVSHFRVGYWNLAADINSKIQMRRGVNGLTVTGQCATSGLL